VVIHPAQKPGASNVIFGTCLPGGISLATEADSVTGLGDRCPAAFQRHIRLSTGKLDPMIDDKGRSGAGVGRSWNNRRSIWPNCQPNVLAFGDISPPLGRSGTIGTTLGETITGRYPWREV
jgi:hypothetical protein